MNGHPGGAAHTRRMLALGALAPGSRVLDMGAGAGETVALLRGSGYDGVGLDLAPRGANVRTGDFLRTGFPDGSFDGVISQCAFYLSGDVPGALAESRRILKTGGVLMLSDVFFEPPVPLLTRAGFSVLVCEDMTAQWRGYYLEAVWRGAADGCRVPRGKCGYHLLIGRKE